MDAEQLRGVPSVAVALDKGVDHPLAGSVRVDDLQRSKWRDAHASTIDTAAKVVNVFFVTEALDTMCDAAHDGCMSNLPDDWCAHYSTCGRCGSRYHASEGGCGCTEEGQCSGCGEHCGSFSFDNDAFICDECCVCENCGDVAPRGDKVDDCQRCVSCTPDEVWLLIRPTGNGEGDDTEVGMFTTREYAEDFAEPLDRLYHRTPKGTVFVEEVAV